MTISVTHTILQSGGTHYISPSSWFQNLKKKINPIFIIRIIKNDQRFITHFMRIFTLVNGSANKFHINDSFIVFCAVFSPQWCLIRLFSQVRDWVTKHTLLNKWSQNFTTNSLQKMKHIKEQNGFLLWVKEHDESDTQ